MRYIFAILILICIILMWCDRSGLQQRWSIETWWNTQSSQETIKQETFSAGEISGHTVFWKDRNIVISSGYLTYDNTFVIELPQNITKRAYNNDSTEWFSLSEDKNINFITYTAWNTGWWRSEMTIREICTPDYQEWINYKPQTNKIMQDDKEYFITYAIFDISGPDAPPAKNYQAEICFVQNGLRYTLSIGSSKAYRKDIVKSFHFLN